VLNDTAVSVLLGLLSKRILYSGQIVHIQGVSRL